MLRAPQIVGTVLIKILMILVYLDFEMEITI